MLYLGYSIAALFGDFGMIDQRNALAESGGSSLLAYHPIGKDRSKHFDAGRMADVRSGQCSEVCIQDLVPVRAAYADGGARTDRTSAKRSGGPRSSKLQQAQLLSAVGVMAVQESGPGRGDVFLYAEIKDGAVSVSLYKNTGRFLQYIDCSRALKEKILELWRAEVPAKRWSGVSMTIAGEKFDADFYYADEWGSGTEIERRDALLTAKYGAMQRRYPRL